MTRVRRALLSVSDKTGLIPFASGLASLGVTLISTGGTARVLREAGLPVTDVAEVTGFSEMLDGRVKTLHPRIHGGLLAIRGNPIHERQMADEGITPIDLVAISLYPFETAIGQKDVSLAVAIENIDIGGPAMLRSAAKNFQDVVVLVDPADYPMALDELKHNHGTLSLVTRYALARKAFAHTARYDATIAGFLEWGELSEDGTWVSTAPPEASTVPDRPLASGTRRLFPQRLQVRLEKLQELRYGENPHQRAAFYRDLSAQGGIASARQLHGKELSYNNILDLHAAWELTQEWAEPVVVIIKHTNPCGVAIAEELVQAYQMARETDPISAYGGILGMNRPLDAATAQEISSTFVEAILAPAYTPEALRILQEKKNLRLLELPNPNGRKGHEMRTVSGGMLVQDRDDVDVDPASLKIVTRRAPSDKEMRALRFAWRVAKHVKSNAIVLATAQATVGIGAGQMSRVDSVRLARMKANLPTPGTSLASDAFFPFRDGVDAAAEAGVTSIIQPG
ncbi:MAG TPA: bifunctional phosphoribosylaminoimidazolecarboxamide formyltransferase/IMP cyclohydrolase, partial [Candidatus Acidoferrum sp.]|nr:bifunctional phosphoribosylaminoimidazolecarboxamide formyltransferase/IMP cyclohydrolase [Candidatus Acidoferrum sp.]